MPKHDLSLFSSPIFGVRATLGTSRDVTETYTFFGAAFYNNNRAPDFHGVYTVIKPTQKRNIHPLTTDGQRQAKYLKSLPDKNGYGANGKTRMTHVLNLK